jgi:chromosome segregation ATPase
LDILQKVTDTKRLVAQLERTKVKISTLEARQDLARRKRSMLQDQTKERETSKAKLLAEAQALHERVAELEREAVVCDTDMRRLQMEVRDIGGNIAECAANVDVAREERTRLAEQLRSTVEETVGSDLVGLLSLCTHHTP